VSDATQTIELSRAAEPAPTGASPAPAPAAPWQPSPGGRLSRILVGIALLIGVFVVPAVLEFPFQQDYVALAAIYACVALSVNVLTGYLGQLSLGHQAFFGIGAFVSANVVTELKLPFVVGLVAAGLTGALSCLILGAVALRVRGLYLAIVTLAYGLLAESSLFLIRPLTGGGAGVEAPRPELFADSRNYAWLCLGVLALLYLFDIRLLKSKAGRAILAIRDDERVAASFGINVTGYKLLAFVICGTYAGLAGALFAHWLTQVVSVPFSLQLALTFVLMTVVGGLGSRIGVVIGGAFFALIDPLLEFFYVSVIGRIAGIFGAELGETVDPLLAPIIGALLLLITLIQYPGGIGQQVAPYRNWLVGGRFDFHAMKDSSAFKAGSGGVGRP
jgi:branched-chain amino acid transport system permease protein